MNERTGEKYKRKHLECRGHNQCHIRHQWCLQPCRGEEFLKLSEAITPNPQELAASNHLIHNIE